MLAPSGREPAAGQELYASYIACELGFYAKTRPWELSGRPPRPGLSAGEGMFHTMLYWLQLMGCEQQSSSWAGRFEQHVQALLDVCRDVGGIPTACLVRQCKTAPAVALARQMYESRDFALMPILADALQDAGCDSPDVLDHCRGGSSHVRGCWVVDLVLGQS